jgi:hypothetical protein
LVAGPPADFALLPHYPRATFAVLDVAGHNLKMEQPHLFGALMDEWLDRVDADSRAGASGDGVGQTLKRNSTTSPSDMM